MTTIRDYLRRELEDRAAADDPELTKDVGIRVVMSARMALLLVDFASQTGERVEMVRFTGDPTSAEVVFHRRDR